METKKSKPRKSNDGITIPDTSIFPIHPTTKIIPPAIRVPGKSSTKRGKLIPKEKPGAK